MADITISIGQGRLLRGLAVKGSVALDRGTMPGNSLGALLTISYSGSIL